MMNHDAETRCDEPANLTPKLKSAIDAWLAEGMSARSIMTVLRRVVGTREKNAAVRAVERYLETKGGRDA